MDAERRREINRENARKSTGPRTAEGKARSSSNAVRHGILSKRLLLPKEDPVKLRELYHGLRKSFRPRGEVEEGLVERLLSAIVRRERAEGVERELWDWKGLVSAGKLPLAEVFFMDSQSDGSLQKIIRYMTACDKEFYRALETLRSLQADRRAKDGEDDSWEEESDGDEDEGPDGAEPAVNDVAEAEEGSADVAAPPASSPASVDGQAEVSQGGGAEEESGAVRQTATRGQAASRTDFGQQDDDREPPKRWDDLTPRAQTLFVVRNTRRVLAVDDLLYEAASNPYRLQRLGPRQLLHQFEVLQRVVSRTIHGIGEILREDESPGVGTSSPRVVGH